MKRCSQNVADLVDSSAEEADLPDGLEEELDDLMTGLSDKVGADHPSYRLS